MFGGEAVGVVILLTLVLIASVSTALTLAIVGAAFWIKRKRKTARRLFGISAFIVVIWIFAGVGAHWYFGSPHVERQVTFTVNPSAKFPGLPGGRKHIESAQITRHKLKGALVVNVTLPDGKRIEGSSRYLAIYDTSEGLGLISLHYSPESRWDQIFDYWSEGGKLLKGGPQKGFIVVQRVVIRLNFIPARVPAFRPIFGFLLLISCLGI